MDDFEKMLQESLRREDPPEGFERRVLAVVNRRRFSWRQVGAIAAMAAVTLGSAWEWDRTRRERQAGEAAKVKLELALRVTSERLHKIHQKVDAVGEGF